MNGGALFRALLVGLLVFSAFTAARAQTARAHTTASVSIEEPARARVIANIITDILTQTAVLTVATAPGTVSSISVPGSVGARDGQDGDVTLSATTVLLDGAGGLAPAGLSISIGGTVGQGAGRAGDGPMLIVVQYN